jgi:hypothetical protein
VSLRVPGAQEMYFTGGPSLRNDASSAVVRIGLDGALLEGDLPPIQGAVVAMHTAIYADSPDVGCVLHTHSPYATAYAVAHRPIGCWVDALAMFGLPSGVPVAGTEGHDLGGSSFGQCYPNARRRGDQPVAHRGLEDRGHPPVDDLDRARSQRAAQRLHPGLDLASEDEADWPRAEDRVGVEAEVGLGLCGCTRAVDLGGSPRLGILLEERPCPGRVDVDAPGQVPPDTIEERLGVALAGELASLLGSPGVLPPTSPIRPVCAFIDACHKRPR